MKKILGRSICLMVLGCNFVSLAKAQSRETATASISTELPVIMKQNVVAGKTPVGTKVEAKLVIASLVNGNVIPRDAVLSGEVIESAAKTKTEPSRLGVRIDSLHWKEKTAPVTLYLTAKYYPLAALDSQDLSAQAAGPVNNRRNWNGMGTYPDPNSPITQDKFPGKDDGKDSGVGSSSPSTNISNRPVAMKNVEVGRQDDGAFFLSSGHSNLKLDRVTTYVFASGDILSQK